MLAAARPALANVRAWLAAHVAPLLGLLAVLLALLPLVSFPIFHHEWVNHVWMTGHAADRLRTDGTFPVVWEVQFIEVGFPILYGWLLYPLVALPALLVGPDGALRLVVVAVNLLVYLAW